MRGKVSFPSYGIAFGRDHPRVCGEKRAVPLATPVRVGSPPRMRGKVVALAMPKKSHWITPAYAGKSNLLPHTRCRSWNHPRICGEKTEGLILSTVYTGSPPHMRGKGAGDICVHCGLGITPAYAGKRNAQRLGASGSRDHPPHMWGKGRTDRAHLRLLGITPAYAGKSQ